MGNTIKSIATNAPSIFSSNRRKSKWTMPTYWIKLTIEEIGADGSQNNTRIIEKFPIPITGMTEFQLQYYLSAYFLPVSDTQLFYQNPISKDWSRLNASEEFVYNTIVKGDNNPTFKLVEIPICENELSQEKQLKFRRLFSMMSFHQRLEYFLDTYRNPSWGSEESRITSGIQIILTALNEGILKDPKEIDHEENSFLVLY